MDTVHSGRAQCLKCLGIGFCADGAMLSKWPPASGCRHYQHDFPARFLGIIFPQSVMAAKMGASDLPKAVSEYFTFGDLQLVFIA